MPIGDFPESLSQRVLVGIILVGRLGVYTALETALRAPACPQGGFTHGTNDNKGVLSVCLTR